MRLVLNTEEHQKFLDSMYHEYTLCEQAFDEFIKLVEINIQGNSDYKILEKLYSSYAKFIVHLYEFYVACFKRSNGSTEKIGYERLDYLFTFEVEKLMNSMCWLIKNDKAPIWVNHINYYQEPVPQDFGEKFRGMRNSLSHVDYRRASGGGNRLTLKEFKENYHKFLFFLFDSARNWWGGKKESPNELEHIKQFNMAIPKD